MFQYFAVAFNLKIDQKNLDLVRNDVCFHTSQPYENQHNNSMIFVHIGHGNLNLHKSYYI